MNVEREDREALALANLSAKKKADACAMAENLCRLQEEEASKQAGMERKIARQVRKQLREDQEREALEFIARILLGMVVCLLAVALALTEQMAMWLAGVCTVASIVYLAVVSIRFSTRKGGHRGIFGAK